MTLHAPLLVCLACAAPAPLLAQTYFPPDPEDLVVESLTPADVMDVVTAAEDDVARCAAEHRRREPDIKGRMVVRWTILPTGKTASVAVPDAEHAKSVMGRCVVSLVRGWSFPRHRMQRGHAVEIPFAF